LLQKEEGEEISTKKRRRNPYTRTPLPAVIGTQEFRDDDYCGLRGK
jgi:hypothetical protein